MFKWIAGGVAAAAIASGVNGTNGQGAGDNSSDTTTGYSYSRAVPLPDNPSDAEIKQACAQEKREWEKSGGKADACEIQRYPGGPWKTYESYR